MGSEYVSDNGNTRLSLKYCNVKASESISLKNLESFSNIVCIKKLTLKIEKRSTILF